MTLNASAVMTFSSYQVLEDGIALDFVCLAPGAGEETDYRVVVTNAELGAVTTLADFRALVLTKLKRRYRAEGIASKLDGLIGQSVTI